VCGRGHIKQVKQAKQKKKTKKNNVITCPAACCNSLSAAAKSAITFVISVGITVASMRGECSVHACKKVTNKKDELCL
jgi:hypothetical protein